MKLAVLVDGRLDDPVKVLLASVCKAQPDFCLRYWSLQQNVALSSQSVGCVPPVIENCGKKSLTLLQQVVNESTRCPTLNYIHLNA